MPRTLMPINAYVDLEHFISWAWGGGDGILRGVSDEAEAAEEGTPSLSVDIGAFSAIVSEHPVRVAAATVGPILPPTGGSNYDLRRKDLIQYTYGVGVNIVTGTEDASPSVPATSADSIPIAHIYCRKGMTVINTVDTGLNHDGYLVDARGFL